MKTANSEATLSQYGGRNGNCAEMSRLMTAAVVSEGFRLLLLANPEQALAAGYNGMPFRLADAERRAILSIRTTSLTAFAAQLTNNQYGGANFENG